MTGRKGRRRGKGWSREGGGGREAGGKDRVLTGQKKTWGEDGTGKKEKREEGGA